MCRVYTDLRPVPRRLHGDPPEELVRKGFAEGVLDIEGMKQRVLSWRDHA